MSTPCNYACHHCDYKSTREYNLRRHMVAKHSVKNVHETMNNVHEVYNNVNDIANNVHCVSENVHPDTSNENSNSKQCPKCNKELSSRSYMLIHAESCKGVRNILQCEYCNKVFASRSSKSNHLRNCKAKQLADSQALVPVLPTPTPAPTNTNRSIPSNSIVGDHNTLHNNNSTTNNTNNTVNNNNTVNINSPNIIVFGPDMKFMDDHISKQMMNRMLKNKDYGSMLALYSSALLKRKENQCVQKTNLRSSTSKVHVGNNVWESRLDQQVFPELMTNIAINFSGSMDTYKIAVQKALDAYIEDVTCNGEHGNGDDKEQIKRMQTSYRTLIGTVKLILFDLTKQALSIESTNLIVR